MRRGIDSIHMDQSKGFDVVHREVHPISPSSFYDHNCTDDIDNQWKNIFERND